MGMRMRMMMHPRGMSTGESQRLSCQKASPWLPPEAESTAKANPSCAAALLCCAQVEFDDEEDDVDEVEVDQTPKRSVHGRQPTAFVKKAKVSTGQAGPGVVVSGERDIRTSVSCKQHQGYARIAYQKLPERLEPVVLMLSCLAATVDVGHGFVMLKQKPECIPCKCTCSNPIGRKHVSFSELTFRSRLPSRMLRKR